MFEKLIIRLSGINCNKINPIDYDILLRSPGQSLDEEMDSIRDKIYDKLFFSVILILISVTVASTFNLPSYFQIITSFIFLGYVIFLIQKNLPLMRNYKLGRDGERSVAQYLSVVARQLSKENTNMNIYHDLVNEKKKFNIDHVVVSKKGIFIVETKMYRKDKGIRNTITSNGKELFINGQKITSNIPLQVKGQVNWLQDELLQKTGKKYEIIPTIAFVGWFVNAKKIDDIYFTSAKTLKHRLENKDRDVLYDDEELKRITSCIHKLATVKNKKYIDICK